MSDATSVSSAAMPDSHETPAFLTFPADLHLAVEHVVRACLAEQGASILESSRFDKLDGQYSYFCFDPVAEVSDGVSRPNRCDSRVERTEPSPDHDAATLSEECRNELRDRDNLQSRDRERAVISYPGGWSSSTTGGSLEALFQQVAQITPEVITKPNQQAAQSAARAPFRGGWVGFIGYEPAAELAGVFTRSIEPLGRAAGFIPRGTAPTNDPAYQLRRRCPDSSTNPSASSPGWMFRLYDTLLIRDNVIRQWMFAGIDWPATRFLSRPPLADRIEFLRRRLESAARSFTPTRQPIDHSSTHEAPAYGDLETSISLSEYRRLVRRAIDYIAAGDIFQVNLTQRFTCRTHRTPAEHYLRLRRVNPSCLSAFLPFCDGAVISSSPELFLDHRAGQVRTKPIKGTRPRCGDDTLNKLAIQGLETSEKDSAELTMIVDLLRNDLGRVCRPGSINVTIPHTIETHPTVFHRVSTIEGTLDERHDWRDLLRATLPGGSITGAPKIRAMQIIHELEPVPRGPYCGCIGYIGLDGSMMMNIAIRTMVQQGNVVSFHAGGAILAGSDTEQEYEEILAKARAMLSAVSFSEAELDPLQVLGASAT